MQGTPKAIEMKGIVRNATKIGVQDGQAEDLINLRFMDGSWRTSGDGRKIENFTMGQGGILTYSQLYIHTNVYRHILGVRDGQLWWFASIDKDGVTFKPLKEGNSTSSDEFERTLPDAPVALTTVHGDLWITQTGHLLTVIDGEDNFEYFVFKTYTKKYIKFLVDENGSTDSRKLFPFGQISLNIYSPFDDAHRATHETEGAQYQIFYQATDVLVNSIKKKNMFSQHFLALVAFELYDGSFAYASNPVHLCPREGINYCASNRGIVYNVYGSSSGTLVVDVFHPMQGIPPGLSTDASPDSVQYLDNIILRADNGKITGAISDNAHWINEQLRPFVDYSNSGKTLGSDLVLSIDKSVIDSFDDTVFKSICIFVTRESNILPTVQSREDLRNRASEFDFKGFDKSTYYRAQVQKYQNGVYQETTTTSWQSFYSPFTLSSGEYYRKKKDIIYDLLHSPFYLLRKYKKEELNDLLENPIVNLTGNEYSGLLENITKQKTLTTEAFSRTTYLPKVSYMYNSRLHIANYRSYPFFGYPIDMFQLHNHSVKMQTESWFKGVLQNLTDNHDEYMQFPKAEKAITTYPDLINNNAPFFIVKVYIEASQSEQVVSRYIPAYDTSTSQEGRADFIEDLNSLLTYPDSRAKKMEIFYVDTYRTEDYIDEWSYDKYKAGVWIRKKEFKLTPHPYLNMACYVDPDLEPIRLSDFELVLTSPHYEDIYNVFDSKTIQELKDIVKIENAEEYFPNGLKVSKTDNPLYFPVENAYQVGSSEIQALCSNAIAVGTGQTGSAPLYVFCADGIYALFVDSSGEMAYTNARVIARDVCNNPRSVTPIDAGVVFTTDRGLMMIAGEQVQEIGSPAEGDVVQFWNAGSVDYSKIATASMQQIAGLPSNLCSTTDFLTYLQDKGTLGKAAIINYNHNMRELMVSNPNYPYSYVLDREGNWSRRDYTAAQYVNNYPTSYRVDEDGHFYKVDDEGNAGTSLEHRKEADNKIFYLSNVIKLDSIGFKQAYRFVVRGYFEAQTGQNVGIVVEGSYDGIKFAPLGFNRKSGKFTNIGCHVSHTDVRFYRVILAGQVTCKTRIDYMEMSASGSVLNTKIR